MDAEEILVSWELIAWKAGQLEYKKKGFQKNEKLFVSDDKCFAWNGLNGIGKPIGKKNKEDEQPKDEERKEQIGKRG